MEGYNCKRCGEFFPSRRSRKHCPKCAKEIGKEKRKIWLSGENGKAYLERVKERSKAIARVYEELPDLSHLIEVVSDIKVHYCKNYKNDNVTCINCYADTTAQYRGCYGKLEGK